MESLRSSAGLTRHFTPLARLLLRAALPGAALASAAEAPQRVVAIVPLALSKPRP